MIRSGPPRYSARGTLVTSAKISVLQGCSHIHSLKGQEIMQSIMGAHLRTLTLELTDGKPGTIYTGVGRKDRIQFYVDQSKFEIRLTHSNEHTW